MTDRILSFDELFITQTPQYLCDNYNILTLVGKDFYAITAGEKDSFNSMVGSGGGIGILLKKAVFWCILREDRYTLELMKKRKNFTITFFQKEHASKMFCLAKESGRNSRKMEHISLTPILTPNENITYAEAQLVLECKLMALTLPQIDNFCMEEDRAYLRKAYEDEKLNRNYVYGEITNIWERKNSQ